MKNKLTIIAIPFLAIAMVTCTGKKTTSEESTEQVAQATAAFTSYAVDIMFQQQLGNLFETYLTLKEALVSTDATLAQQSAGQIHNALNNIDHALLTGEAVVHWEKLEKAFRKAVQPIQDSSDIEAQRTSFVTVTEQMYGAIKSYGLGGLTAYYEYCPMAFDNSGAHWLSNSQEIRNPYFGDKMLHCGKVKETLE